MNDLPTTATPAQREAPANRLMSVLSRLDTVILNLSGTLAETKGEPANAPSHDEGDPSLSVILAQYPNWIASRAEQIEEMQ